MALLSVVLLLCIALSDLSAATDKELWAQFDQLRVKEQECISKEDTLGALKCVKEELELIDNIKDGRCSLEGGTLMYRTAQYLMKTNDISDSSTIKAINGSFEMGYLIFLVFVKNLPLALDCRRAQLDFMYKVGHIESVDTLTKSLNEILCQITGIQINSTQAHWSRGYGLFTPSININIKNVSNRPMNDIKIVISFVYADKKEIFSSAQTYVQLYGTQPLKPGYSKSATLIAEESLKYKTPDLVAEIYIKGQYYYSIPVEN